MSTLMKFLFGVVAALAVLTLAHIDPAFAQAAGEAALAATPPAPPPSPINTGDTAWMLTSTALVMIMLPGLALFYGGLVRRKNVLSTVMHSFFGLALVSIVWVIVGFTLALDRKSVV